MRALLGAAVLAVVALAPAAPAAQATAEPLKCFYAPSPDPQDPPSGSYCEVRAAGQCLAIWSYAGSAPEVRPC